MMQFKFCVLAFVMLIASPALANWTRIGGTEKSNSYFDFATLKIEGNFRKIWELADLHTTGVVGEKSRIFRSEFDCKQERTRMLTVNGFSGQMGNGKLIATESDADPWRDIQPGSIASSKLRIVCSK